MAPRPSYHLGKPYANHPCLVDGMVVVDPWREVLVEARRLWREAEAHLGVAHLEVAPEMPPEGMGDVAFPVFPYAPVLRSPPPAIAAQFQGALGRGTYVQGARATGGYVNLTLDPRALARVTLESVLHRRGEYGNLPPKGTKVIVEHTSVNPNGPVHVGRLRNPLIGDALARMLQRAGYDVIREFLVNDMGKQIILMYWGFKHLRPEEVGPPEKDREEYRLVRCYQGAVRRAQEDTAVEAQVAELSRRYEAGDRALAAEVRAVCQGALDAIVAGLGDLGVSFDRFFWESTTILDGRAREVAERLKALPQAVRESDGAYYLDLGDPSLGLPEASPGGHGRGGAEGAGKPSTRWFFLRKDGTTLYTTRDVAYHLDKFRRCDEAINVLGEDQKLGALQLRAALRLLGVGREPEPIFYAFVVLPEGRLSTRKGTVLWADDLVEEAVERAYEEVKGRRADMPEGEKRRIARAVGIGALKYNYVRVQAEKKIVFRWEEALNFEGNSAPFLQYAHARTCGILDRAGGRGEYDAAALEHPSELRLVKVLAQFPSTVEDCAEARRPHAMATYAFGVASQLNQFYRDCPVLTAPGPLRAARLAVVDATCNVLANALDTLGIEAPREM